MAGRFASDASSVVNHADRIARELRHQALDTGHLLLGLIRAADQNGCAAEIDELLGVPAARIRDWLTGALGPGKGVPPEHMPATAAAMAVIDQTSVEAHRLGDPAARPVHILLALIAQDGGSAVDALRTNGVDLARVRRLITERAEAGHSAPVAPPDLLAGVTRDLAARTPPAGPVVGRSAEIDRVVQTLTRHHRNVPLLVGEPGVGKKTVAAGVAVAIAEGRVPAALLNRTVRALDLGAVLAMPRHRARGGALVTGLLDEAAADTGLVLYLSGALTPVRLPEGSATPLALFRSVLGAEGVLVFGDCGRAEYERRDPDPGLDRLVQPVLVEEPSAAEVRDILRGVRGRLAAHHDAVLTDGALEAAGTLARDRIPDHSLPGSAVDLLDEAAALARTRAARSAPSADEPVRVTEADVTLALAARSGIRASAPPRATAPQAGPPAQHDPSIWSLS